jgi:hypothetical protein
VIRLALRLAVAGGREAVARLAIIAVAVAVGSGLLLTVIAGLHAVNAQNGRYAWMNTGLAQNPANTGPAATAPALWLSRWDSFHGEQIGRIDLAMTGPDFPAPPGVVRMPRPGEYVVSPAMADLLRTVPADQLGDRYPGHQIGTISTAGLPAPTSLLIIVGRTPAELEPMAHTHTVNRIETRDPRNCKGCQAGTTNDGIDLILSVVGTALAFPLLMFIGTATRLSAARREERFAAMRLVGATPRQVSVIATVESTVAALVGVVAGFGLYAALRSPVAAIPFTGERFFVSDVRITAVDGLVILLGVPLAAAVAARIALRRVRVSPLGVSRRTTPAPPRVWRLVPVLAGLAELAYFVGRSPESTDGQIAAYLSGIFIVMIGLVVAGPWLTMTGARLLAARARRPAALIAARRLADNPRAGFRAVSGLMLALFVTAVASGAITTMNAERGLPEGGTALSNMMGVTFWGPDLPHGQRPPTAADVPASLRTIPGVGRIVLVRANPDFRYDVPSDANPGLIACDVLARYPAAGVCEPGQQVAQIYGGLSSLPEDERHFPPTHWTVGQLSSLPLLALDIETDGAPATIERLRTTLATAFPWGLRAPGTDAEDRRMDMKQLVQWQQLADVVILTTLPIAGCSLAVAIAAGLSERRRPFSLLRLTGARLDTLRRVIALESAVPLLLVAVLATGTGLLACQLFLKAQLDYDLHLPGPSYWLLVAAGLIASLGIIASTLPLLRRITGPEAARND